MSFQTLSIPFARFSLFLIYFWFGVLKVIGMSPATPLVEQLFNQTVPFMTFSTFIVLFGIFECLIGALFLIPGIERATFGVFIAHMIMTTGPLFILRSETWSGFLVPTLEGQYIIKNIALVSVALSILLSRRRS